jgi:hypothetical protein
MTEAEWLAETTTHERYWLLTSANSCVASKQRKTRLFLAACLRCVRHLAGDAAYQRAVLVTEGYADGQASDAELAAAHAAARSVVDDLINPDLDHSREQVVWHTVQAATSPVPPSTPAGAEDHWCRGAALVSHCVAECVADDAVPGGKDDYTLPDDPRNLAILGPRGLEHQAACDGQLLRNASLFRDVFGPLLFRPVAFSPAWRTDTALSLARVMYEAREFGAMPILADALEDAGCDSDDILSHCRDPKAAHVRGCWVCDLVLGKE